MRDSAGAGEHAVTDQARHLVVFVRERDLARGERNVPNRQLVRIGYSARGCASCVGLVACYGVHQPLYQCVLARVEPHYRVRRRATIAGIAEIHPLVRLERRGTLRAGQLGVRSGPRFTRTGMSDERRPCSGRGLRDWNCWNCWTCHCGTLLCESSPRSTYVCAPSTSITTTGPMPASSTWLTTPGLVPASRIPGWRLSTHAFVTSLALSGFSTYSGC